MRDARDVALRRVAGELGLRGEACQVGSFCDSDDLVLRRVGHEVCAGCEVGDLASGRVAAQFLACREAPQFGLLRVVGQVDSPACGGGCYL